MENNSEKQDTEEEIYDTSRTERLSFAIDTREDIYKGISIKEYIAKDEKFGKKIYYTIVGSDKSGNFQVVRRYKEFFTLRSILVDAWPGFYIPKIPAKQKIVIFT